MAAEREHPLVQHDLATRTVDGEGEPPVRARLRAHHTGVGAPEQPAHPRSTTRRPRQRLDDRRPALGEELIAIASPPHDVDRAAVTRRGQHARQGVVVHTSVHQRADRVALGPRPEAGRAIAALELREEPVPDRALTRLPDPESRSHQRQELLAVRRPDHRRTDASPDRSRQIDLRAIHVEHLPQPDHRNTVRAAVREIDEHPRVVPPIIPEEHPPHGRHPVREMFDSGKLARPTAPDDPSRREAAARRHQRPRRITVTSQQARDRPSQHLRKGGQVDHRRAAQIRRDGADKPGHGQHRTTIAKTGRAQRPKPPQQTTQRPPPEHTIHIENHAMGIAARHRQTPAVTRSTFDVWRRARAPAGGRVTPLTPRRRPQPPSRPQRW